MAYYNQDKGYKPVFSASFKMIESKILNEEWVAFVVEVKETDVKEILLKIVINETYYKNFKILNQYDVKILREVLVHLRSVDYPNTMTLPHIDEIIKNGIIHEIICTITRILPYLCQICNKNISYKDGNPHMRCISCGV